MTRSRFPAPWAITQLVFRTISVGLSVAALISAIYSSVQYGYGRSVVGSYIASIWAIMVDAPEVAGLADSTRRTRRCSEGWNAFLSVLTMLICAILPIAVYISVFGLYYKCGGRQVEVCREEERLRNQGDIAQVLAWLLPAVVAGLHFFFSIVGCVGLCTRKRND